MDNKERIYNKQRSKHQSQFNWREYVKNLKEEIKRLDFGLKFATNLLRLRYGDIDQAKAQIQNYKNEISQRDQQINFLKQQNESLSKFIDEMKQDTNYENDDSIDDCEVCECENCQDEDDNDDELKFDIQDLLPYNEISKKIQMLNDKVDSVVNVTQSILEIIEQIFCQPHDARITWIVEKDD